MTILCDHFPAVPSTRSHNGHNRIIDLAYFPFFDVKAALTQCFGNSASPKSAGFEVSILSRRKDMALGTLCMTQEEHLARLTFENAITRPPEKWMPPALWLEEEQRAKRKVYKWEEYFLSRWTKQTSHSHFEDLVTAAARDYGIPVPSVEVNPRQQSAFGKMQIFSSYSFPRNRISVHPLMLNPLTGMHETAHAILDHQMGGAHYMGHGPSFVRLVCDLYETYLGCPASLLKPQTIRMDIWGAPETECSVHAHLSPTAR